MPNPFVFYTHWAGLLHEYDLSFFHGLRCFYLFCLTIRALRRYLGEYSVSREFVKIRTNSGLHSDSLKIVSVLFLNFNTLKFNHTTRATDSRIPPPTRTTCFRLVWQIECLQTTRELTLGATELFQL